MKINFKKTIRSMMKKILISTLCLISFVATAASLTNSYLDGAKRVCEYDDGSIVYVNISSRCPNIKY